jgi:epoxyqueuosine reductase QueG
MAECDWTSLKKWIQEQAPVQIAAGDIKQIRKEFELSKMQDLAGMDYAVSMAFPLPRECLAGISDAPTLIYKHAYSQANYLMDRTALGLALRLQEEGFGALAVPASQITDWERLLGHVNHRQVAARLGQGWFGRNNLLVTPERGARVRLVTVLTDARIEDPGPWADRAEESGCDECERCAPVCPAGAIHNGPEDFDRPACSEKVREFEKIRGIGQRICGVCVKACSGPPGRAT